jgi:hypothetical protein
MKHRIELNSDLLVGSIIFLLATTPSLKFIIFSPVLNFIPIILFGLVFIIKRGRFHKKWSNPFLILIIFFFVVLLSAFYYSFNYTTTESVIKILLLSLLSTLLPPFISEKSILYGVYLIWIWGFFLSIIQLFIPGVIQFDKTEGLHYLTIGLPIAMFTLISFYFIIQNNNFNLRFIFNFLFLFFGIFAASSLYGRAPIIFTFFVIISYFIFKYVKFKSLFRIKYLIVFIASSLILYNYKFIIKTILPWHLSYRINNLIVNWSKEDRIQNIYIPIIKWIRENPMGYGLDSSFYFIGTYPHNIFLEIFVSSGVFAFLLFVLLTIQFLKSTIYIIKYSKKIFLAFSLITMYLFFVWNVSFRLNSAYALIPFMGVVIFIGNNYSNIINCKNDK